MRTRDMCADLRGCADVRLWPVLMLFERLVLLPLLSAKGLRHLDLGMLLMYNEHNMLEYHYSQGIRYFQSYIMGSTSTPLYTTPPRFPP